MLESVTGRLESPHKHQQTPELSFKEGRDSLVVWEMWRHSGQGLGIWSGESGQWMAKVDRLLEGFYSHRLQCVFYLLWIITRFLWNMFVPSTKGHTADKWPCWDLNAPSGPGIQDRVDAPALRESWIKCCCLCSGITQSTISWFLLLTVWALNTFFLTFTGLPLGESTLASLTTICLFPLGQLGEEGL